MKRSFKRLMSMLLTLTMALGLLPGMPLTVLAAGEVCEIIRGGSVFAGYTDLGVALVELRDGDIIKLLDHISYEGRITLVGSESDPMDVTLDLNGKKLDVISPFSSGLYMSYGGLSLINGGELNISASNEIPDGFLQAVEVYHSTVELTSASVQNNGTAVYGEYSDISITGNLTGSCYTDYDSELFVGGSISGDLDSYGSAEVLGDIGGHLRAGSGTVSISGNVGGWVDTWAELTIGGDVGGYIDISDGNATVTSDIKGIRSRGGKLHLTGDVIAEEYYEGAAIECSGEGELYIDGDIICANGSAVMIRYQNSDTCAPVVTVTGTVLSLKFLLLQHDIDTTDGIYERDEKTADDFESVTTKAGYLTYKGTARTHTENAVLWTRDNSAGGPEIYSALLTNANEPDKSYADIHDNLTITVYGSKGMTASAEVSYTDSLSGNASAKITVPLTEDAGNTGIYRGSFEVVEGMSCFNGVTVTIGDGTKTASDEISERHLPEIRGQLLVDIVNPYYDQYPETKVTGLLTLAGDGRGNSINIDAKGSRVSYAIKGLPPGNNYSLELRESSGVVMNSQTNIVINAGMTTRASDITKSMASGLNVYLEDYSYRMLNGISYQNYYISYLRDADTKEVLLIKSLWASGWENLLKSVETNRNLELVFHGGRRNTTTANGKEALFYPLETVVPLGPLSPGMNNKLIHMSDYAYHKTAVLEGTVTIKDTMNAQTSPLINSGLSITQKMDG